MPKYSKELKAGDRVFAKIKGYSAWPARVNKADKDEKIPKGKLPIFFYGTRQFCIVSTKDIYPYAEFKHKYGQPKKRKFFKEALDEIENDQWVEWPESDEDGPISLTTGGRSRRSLSHHSSPRRSCNKLWVSGTEDLETEPRLSDTTAKTRRESHRNNKEATCVLPKRGRYNDDATTSAPAKHLKLDTVQDPSPRKTHVKKTKGKAAVSSSKRKGNSDAEPFSDSQQSLEMDTTVQTPAVRQSPKVKPIKINGARSRKRKNKDQQVECSTYLFNAHDPKAAKKARLTEARSANCASPTLHTPLSSLQTPRKPQKCYVEGYMFSDSDEEDPAWTGIPRLKFKKPPTIKSWKKVAVQSLNSLVKTSTPKVKETNVTPRRMFEEEPAIVEAPNYMRYEFDIDLVMRHLKDTGDWKRYVTEIEQRPSCMNVIGWLTYLINRFHRVEPARFFDLEVLTTRVIENIAEVNPKWNKHSRKSRPFAELVTFDIATKMDKDNDFLKRYCICKSNKEQRRPSWNQEEKEAIVGIFHDEFKEKRRLTLESVQSNLKEHRTLQDLVLTKLCHHGKQSRERRFYATLKRMIKTANKV